MSLRGIHRQRERKVEWPAGNAGLGQGCKIPRKGIRIISRLATILICIAVPAILHWIYKRSAAGQALVEQDSIIFPESKAVSIIRWSGLVLFSAAAFAFRESLPAR